MITATCQRWRDRRGAYRPAGEVIRTADYEVAEIAGDPRGHFQRVPSSARNWIAPMSGPS